MLATSPGLLAGTTMATMMLTCGYAKTAMMGVTYIDMVTASMSLMSLGPTPYGSGPPPQLPSKDVTEWESKD